MPDHPGWTCRNKAFVYLDRTPRLLKRAPIVRIQRCSVDTASKGIGLDCDKTKTMTKGQFEKKKKEDRCDGRFNDVFVDLQ